MSAEPSAAEFADDTGAYRYRVLRALGFDVAAAMVLAQSKADWHDVEDALEHGCSHELAVRIFV